MYASKYESGHFNTIEEALDWGWVAGIIDGEGSIGVYRRAGKDAKRWPSNHLTLRIGMTDRATLARVVKITGVGSIHALKPSTHNGKGYFGWIVANRSAASVLNKVSSLLITKQQQCILALQFYGLVRKFPPKGIGHPVPKEIMDERKKIRTDLLELNRRGQRKVGEAN